MDCTQIWPVNIYELPIIFPYPLLLHVKYPLLPTQPSNCLRGSFASGECISGLAVKCISNSSGPTSSTGFTSKLERCKALGKSTLILMELKASVADTSCTSLAPAAVIFLTTLPSKICNFFCGWSIMATDLQNTEASSVFNHSSQLSPQIVSQLVLTLMAVAWACWVPATCSLNHAHRSQSIFWRSSSA